MGNRNPDSIVAAKREAVKAVLMKSRVAVVAERSEKQGTKNCIIESERMLRLHPAQVPLGMANKWRVRGKVYPCRTGLRPNSHQLIARPRHREDKFGDVASGIVHKITMYSYYHV